ncbi:MAG TPA: hypothetical protein ENN33_01625 [Ignavibacteria bacterium]|nr:hypothetical protein [Ignavibacteria bacterium]
MLKGIENIKSGSGAENSSKNIYKKFLANSTLKQIDSHDSLNISKGYRILKEYNIDLKRFKKNEYGLLEIIFDLSAIEFSTLLNLDNLTNYIKLDYKLNLINEPDSFVVSISTRTYYSENIDNYLKINDIVYLMSRIKSLNVGNEINLSNTRALSNLLDGVYNAVLSEFNMINSILVKASKNIFNISIKMLPLSELENELLLIEKIMPSNEHSIQITQ